MNVLTKVILCFGWFSNLKKDRKKRLNIMKVLIVVSILSPTLFVVSSARASSAHVGSVGFMCHKMEGLRSILYMSFGHRPYVVTIVDQSNTAYKVAFDQNKPPGYSEGDCVWIPHHQFSYKNNCL